MLPSSRSFASLASMVQTGDVCLFYFGTHGGVDPGTTNPGLWLYQKGIYYSEENLANHIDSLAADWGVATVGIVHACHSGGLADNSNDTYCKGGWCVNSMLTSPNAAWITSTDSADVSAVGDHFLEFLIGYGWEKGWAGSEGKALTFGSLADYMGKTYDELFSGVLVEDNPKVIKAGITNKPLLDRIAVGICAHHETKPKPTAFSITPSTDDPDKVSLKTSEVSADKLSVFSRFVRTGRWTLWDPYDGNNQPALYCLNQDTTKKGEAANTRHSSENDKMEFIVKAYTGAGVTAASNNPVQGWRAAMAAQTEDGRTWNYGKVEGGVSIVSAAESSAPGYGDALKGDVAIPSTLNGMSIVSISSHAFEGCEEITSVTIPDSVTSIGDRAFYGCTGLTSVTISDSVTNIGEHAFAECDQLQSLVFPPSVKSIGYGAVSYCESLDRIALSENLESIGDFAFYGNPALTAVYIPSSVKEIGMGAFAYCDSLASIDVADGNAEYASANGMLFTKDKKTLLFVPGGMREMLVPSGVELIGASAAEGCFNLEIASLPASVIEIGEFAFAYCSKLPRFRIPDQVRAIGDAAFLQCGSMEDIALPASLTTLGDGVFAGCTNIVSLTVAGSNTNFMVLDDILYGQDLSTLYYALNSVRKVHVPEGVKSIASDAFVFCKELQDVVLPSSLNRIASEAFGCCDALGSIRIPKGVSEIGEYAFYECDNLTNICFEGNAPSVGDHAFDEIAPTCVVHVCRDSTGWDVDIPGTWNGLRIEYFNDAPKLVGMGKVTVPKSWKTGQKVTWKATADKGSVFARWDGLLVDSLNLTVNERRNPSLAFAVPEGFDTNMVTAVFIPIDDDGLYSLGITQTEFELKEAVSDVRVTDDSQSYVTATASGLPTGLKFDAKKMAITGTPTKSGVYWVQIKAKNASGYQWAENVRVTVSGGGTEAKEPKLTRAVYYPLTVICANEGGTVSGTGVYAEGKKVSVKATPAKGYVFAGWHETANSEKGTVNGVDGADYRSASLNMTVPETRYVFALFATKEDDADSLNVAVEDVTTEKDGTIALDLGACVASLSLPKLAVSGLPSGVKYDAKTLKLTGKATKPGVYTVTVKATNAAVTKATDASTATFRIMVPNFECAALPGLKPETDAYGIVRSGVKFDDGLVDCSPADGWTVKVAGLPSGLKWDAKTGKIVGVPTAKAGSYTVTFTASKKGEANQIATITLNVEALPDWVVGTFYGKNVARGLRGTWTCPQQFTVTISANGKISMKTVSPGEGAESRTAQLTECREDGSFAFSFHYASGRKGKDGYSEGDCAGVISPVAYGEDGALLGCLTTQDIGVCDEDDDPFESKGVVYQSLYSRKPAVSGLPVFGKDNIRVVPVKSDCSDGEVTLKFGTKGAVTAAWSGTKPAATCSSYISPYARDADGTVHAKLWLTFLDKTRIDGYGDFVQTGFEFDLLIPASDKVSASDVDVVSARLTSIIADVLNGDDVELVQQ